MMERRYRRYFIIFELEDKNFGTFVGEEAKGHAKIEIKNNRGLLSIYCQNLGADDGNKYQWYLIDMKTEEAPTIVEIGPMEVDKRGKGELTCEFDVDNVKGSMEKMDNFDVLALAVQNGDGKDELCTPLVGYMNKDRPATHVWKYALGEYLHIPVGDEETAREEKTVQVYQPMEETAGEAEKPEEEIVEEVEESQEEIPEEKPEETGEEIPEEVEERAGRPDEEIVEGEAVGETEEIGEKTPEETIKETAKDTTMEATEEIKRKIKEEYEDGSFIKTGSEQEDDGSVDDDVKIEETEDSHKDQMQLYIENALEDFPKIEPFADKLEGYSWWQVPYDAQTMYGPFMPFILYLDSLDEPEGHHIAEILQAVSIQKHHIFGICYDENGRAKYYAYGILDRKLFPEQPFGLSETLTYWHPCDDVPTNIKSYGYWILTLDPETGKLTKYK